MARTTSSKDLAEQIEQLVREHIAASRQAARDAVERAFASTSRETTPRSHRSATASRVPQQHRSPEEVAALGDQLYGAICAFPGERIARLAEEVGSTATALNQPMRRLKKAGRIRTVGRRGRQTRYFPMATAD